MEGRPEENSQNFEQMFLPDMQMKGGSEELSVEEMAALVCLPAWQQQHLSTIVKEESLGAERNPDLQETQAALAGTQQHWESYYGNLQTTTLDAGGSKDTAVPCTTTTDSITQILIISPPTTMVLTEQKIVSKKVNGVKKHKCSVCSKLFYKPSDLKRHETTHSLVKPYTCKTCGVSYRHQRSLSVHNRTVNCADGEQIPIPKVKVVKKIVEVIPKLQTSSPKILVKKFQCPICEKLFSKPSDLKRHEVTHSSLRPYPCEVCGITYRHMRSLKSHVRTVHSSVGQNESSTSEEKKVEETAKKLKVTKSKIPPKKVPATTTVVSETVVTNEEFKCEVCSTIFSQKSELDAHLQPKFESANTNLPCLYCGAHCSDAKELEDHVKDAHNMCKVCVKIFKNKEILSRHETKHSLGQIIFYQCHCGLEFKVFDKFETHVKTKHENLNFYLNNFIKRPVTDIKNLQYICDKRKRCPYCNKYLQDEIILQNHKIKFHKVFKCMLCTNHFIANKSSNSDAIPFQCESCEFNKIQKCTVCNNLFIANKTKSDVMTTQCTTCQLNREESFLLPHTFTFYGDNNAAGSEGGEMSSSDIRLETSIKPELLGCEEEDVKMEMVDHPLPATDW